MWPLESGIVWKRMWVMAGADLLCSHFRRGVQEISARHPPRWREGGGRGRDKGPFPNATARAAAGREEALNWRLLYQLCLGKVIDEDEGPQKQKAD